MRFNTAISAMMILVKHLGSGSIAVPRDAARTLALLLSPFAPHLGEELWEQLGEHRRRSRTSRGRRSIRRS
jgi:leucyl-tRNA synthetase